VARFVGGQIPWNKGTKGLTKPNSGSFKKGRVARNKKTPINKKCAFCGKEFSVRPSWERVKCCSMSCSGKLRKPPMLGRKFSQEHRKKLSAAKYGFRGEQHWNWKGGYSSAYRLRRSSDYKNWRTAVFLRDNFTCQKCGDKNIYVTAHHIKSFSHYPELRFDINNGMTLCEECHSQTDNYKCRAKKEVVT
jgi:hypothetical protein